MTTRTISGRVFRENLTNRSDSAATLSGSIADSGIVLSRLVEDAIEDAIDDDLLREATERRGDRPFSSYRSLEDLMSELGD